MNENKSICRKRITIQKIEDFTYKTKIYIKLFSILSINASCQFKLLKSRSKLVELNIETEFHKDEQSKSFINCTIKLGRWKLKKFMFPLYLCDFLKII